MGNWCKICGKNLPHERFSGKGHKSHICKRCAAKPINDKKSKQHISNKNNVIEEIANFLIQQNISDKNMQRLEYIISSTSNQQISDIAKVVLEVAKVHPRKKKRLSFLQRERKDIIERFEELDFMFWSEHE